MFNIATSFYLSFVTERVKRCFLISNSSADKIRQHREQQELRVERAWSMALHENINGISVSRNVYCGSNITTHGYEESTSPFEQTLIQT